MIDLEVCRKCWQLRNVVWRPEAKYTIKERGFVYCEHDLIKAYINGDPTDICPFKFEHGVASGMRNDKQRDL